MFIFKYFYVDKQKNPKRSFRLRECVSENVKSKTIILSSTGTVHLTHQVASQTSIANDQQIILFPIKRRKMAHIGGSGESTLIQQKGSFVEKCVAKAASACNKTIVENCGLCTVYCDKQVQYETVVEQYSISTQLGGLFKKLDNTAEVQVCRDFLFDEDSVVQQANSRSDDA